MQHVQCFRWKRIIASNPTNFKPTLTDLNTNPVAVKMMDHMYFDFSKKDINSSSINLIHFHSMSEEEQAIANSILTIVSGTVIWITSVSLATVKKCIHYVLSYW